MRKKTETLINGAYHLVLDASQIIPDDPGAGTPAMVYGPRGTSATYWCAVNEGVVSSSREDIEIPARVLRWLASKEEMVGEWIDANEPETK